MPKQWRQNRWFSLLTLIARFGLVKFDLIFTIKIFANFVKPIVTTITLFPAANTKFVAVPIQYILKIITPPPNCLDLCCSVKLQGCNFQRCVQ